MDINNMDDFRRFCGAQRQLREFGERMQREWDAAKNSPDPAERQRCRDIELEVNERRALGGLPKHFIFRAKKLSADEFVTGNRLSRYNGNDTYWLAQIIVVGKNRNRLKKVNEWLIDPDNVFYNDGFNTKIPREALP